MTSTIIQAAFVLFTILFAHFQVPINKAFRDYVPINNPYNTAFHNRSVPVVGLFAAVLIIWFVCDSQIVNWVTILKAASFIPLFIAWYKLLFDGYLGWKVHDDFFYLGDSSKQDVWIKETFQFTGAGEAKAVLCGCVILAVNLFVL